MAINAVTGTDSNPLQASALGMEDFLKILLTQLQYQNPLDPMDNQQFMAQMAQFTTLQQTQQLNTNIETLITNQASLQSVGLIGRTVDVSTESGPLTGTVTSLSLSGATPQIAIRLSGGTTIPDIGLGQIVAVR